MKGRLFVISAPSGSGKTTLCGLLLKQVPGLVRSISSTSRPPRRGEKNRRDYFFMDEAAFRMRERRGYFLESARVFGAYYGTPKSYVLECLRKGRDVLLSIDVQGARQVKKRFPDAVLIFILPPSMKVLARRLRRRGTDHMDAIRRRLAVARQELKRVGRYDYAVVNQSLKKSLTELKAIFIAERKRIKKQKGYRS